MFVDHTAVLDRHQPAGKGDEAGTQRFMTIAQRRFAQYRILRVAFIVSRGHSRPFGIGDLEAAEILGLVWGGVKAF